jgi:hypothetical protein
MPYFDDLSDHTRLGSGGHRARTKNVGWLGSGHEYPKATPDDEILDLVWDYCAISVEQTRGIHDCQFCPPGTSYYVERNGEKLLLGSAEIRVFAKDGVIYAAPTLIYHYLFVHHYKPPDEFVRALTEGPKPPSKEYFERLDALGLEWNNTSAPVAKPRRFEFARTRDGRLERIELP